MKWQSKLSKARNDCTVLAYMYMQGHSRYVWKLKITEVEKVLLIWEETIRWNVYIFESFRGDVNEKSFKYSSYMLRSLDDPTIKKKISPERYWVCLLLIMYGVWLIITSDGRKKLVSLCENFFHFYFLSHKYIKNAIWMIVNSLWPHECTMI